MSGAMDELGRGLGGHDAMPGTGVADFDRATTTRAAMLRRAKDEAEASALRWSRLAAAQARLLADLLAGGHVPQQFEALARKLAVLPEDRTADQIAALDEGLAEHLNALAADFLQERYGDALNRCLSLARAGLISMPQEVEKW